MYYDVFERLLKEKGVSVAEVSVATGIGKSTFTAWKRGDYTPKSDKRQKVADYFGVTLDYLDGRTKTPRPIYEVGAGAGRCNGFYSDNYTTDNDDGFTFCTVYGDSMYPILMDGDVLKVQIQTATSPRDLTIVKVDGETATCKYVEVTDKGVWLRAENKEVFADRFYTVQEVLTLPITIIGKVVEMRRGMV